MAMATQTGRKVPPTPPSVSRYELRDKLGEGGMGVVWRALDTKTRSEVAIKIMKDASDPGALELFTKEWRALAEMSHPNIIDVRDVDFWLEDNEEKPYFVMPLLRGCTLSELIGSSSERLTRERVVEIVSQVCRGLQAAHQRGLVHRDLKPSNIFVMEDDTAKVIDFGVVYLAGSHSVTGQKGTFQYMSPEQIQMKEVTPASDIFSLGIILYEALTGRKPFARHTADETMQAVLKLIPPPVSELNPSIPHPISQVVHKCLAKQPIHRFSSAKEVSDALQKAIRNEPIFDVSKLRMRIEKAKDALKAGDEGLASELLSELESEGHLDPEITHLRMQIDMAVKQKRIRQLWKRATGLIEQDEIPLGLDKLRELLELDPENADALALKKTTESKISEAQVGKWMELANTHLDNRDFASARHANEQALACRPGDTKALAQRSRIESVESEAKRVHDQKEQLYNTAWKAYQHGEIDSALNRLDRLFSLIRTRPEGAVPERDAVYDRFYKEVRSEHDSYQSMLEEAQHHFGEENFTQALVLCDQLLAKYPNSDSLKALRIQIEDAERQKISAYVALVSKNAEAEPDYDRRVNMWREASERYPGEAHFAKQMKVDGDKRDFINSIVGKAHQYGERGMYSEELAQWDMLRNIHSRYPGLAFELERCRKKRDEQALEEDKAHWVEEIVGLMESRNYAKALERTRLAISEFPGDAELLGLEKLSNDGLERSQESNRLLEAGQAAAAAENWAKAVDLLREAQELDPRNSSVKDLLIHALTEQARALLKTDAAEAERWRLEAESLDPNHRDVRALAAEIYAARRLTYVGECLTRARALAATDKIEAAYEVVREGLKEYPRDKRLEDYEAWLLERNEGLRILQERSRRAADPVSSHPESQTPVRRAEISDFSSLGRTTTARGNLTESDDRTKVFVPKPEARAAKPVCPPSPSLASRLAAISPKARKIALAVIGALLVLAVAAFAVVRILSRKAPPPPPPAEVATVVHFSATPEGSVFKIDGLPVSGGQFSVPPGKSVSLEVSHLGYKSQTIQLDGKSTVPPIVLEPQPIRIAITTLEKSGSVQLDGNAAGDLTDGSIDELDVNPDGNSHTLVLTGGGRQLANLQFDAKPGERPHLTSMKSRDMIVTSTLGPAATIYYGGGQLRNPAMEGAPTALSGAGTDFSIAGQQSQLTYTDASGPGTLALTPTDSPTLTLRSLGAGSAVAITSNVDSATLTANGSPVKRGTRGWRITEPKTYNFVLSADGYEPQSWTTVLMPGQTVSLSKTLQPKVVAATLSALSISGGTPDAEVYLDGENPIERLNGSGALQVQAKLSAGGHKIQFRKTGFCSSPWVEITAAPPLPANVNGEKIEACGSITVAPGVQGARIQARRSGDANAKAIELVPGRKTAVPAAKYEVHGESAGFDAWNATVTVVQGADASLTPVFKLVQHCGLVNADEVTTGNGWMKPKEPDTIVGLTPGCVNATLTFEKPKGLFEHKRVEFSLAAPGGKGRISYELDNDKLTRKASADNKTFDKKENDVKQKIKADDHEFLVRIRVEGSRIVVMNDRGETLDDYTAQNPALHDLAGGSLALKTSAQFKFAEVH